MQADTTSLHWRGRRPATDLPLSKLLPVIRAGVAAAPERVDLRRNLAAALFATDRMDELYDRLGRFAAGDDCDTATLYYVGRAALATRNYEAAADALRPAAAMGHTNSFAYLAEALLKLGRIDEAMQAGLEGLEDPSSDFKSLYVLAQMLLPGGEADRLWNVCMTLRERGAWGGYLPAVMALTAASLGYDDEVGKLMDRARWFSMTDLPVPDDFNRRLAAELSAHKSLGALHSTKATRGAGAWIEGLQTTGEALAQELLRRIRVAVEGYVADRSAFTDHPTIARRPAVVEMVAWAVKVHHDGHQRSHIHPAGWISGVYYVDVPQIADDRDGAGAVEFGLLSLEGKFSLESKSANADFQRWRIMPRPGMLLLFPSYFAHATLPTGSGDDRLCVAFDVEPASAGPDVAA